MATLKLYTAVNLCNAYNDVFESQELLESYLASHESASLYDVTYYMKNKGDLNLSLKGYVDVPNYMAYIGDSGTRYYFIDNVEVYNGVVKLTYTIDVWHTYVSVTGIRFGHRVLSNTGKHVGEHLLPGSEAVQSYKGLDDAISGLSGGYVVVCTGYVYTGEKPASGIPTHGTPFIGYSTSGYSTGVNARNQLTSLASLQRAIYAIQYFVEEMNNVEFYYRSGSTSSYTYTREYIELNRFFVIPSYVFEGDVSKFQATSYNLNVYYNNSGTYTSGTLVIGTGGSYHLTLTNSALEYVSGSSADTSVLTTEFDLPQAVEGTTIYKSIGTFTSSIDIPYKQFTSVPKGRILYTSSVIEPCIMLSAYGHTVDLTTDFEMNLPFDNDTMLAAEQRKNNAIQSMISAGGSIAKGTLATGVNFGMGNITGGIAGMIDLGTSLAGTAMKLAQKQTGITPAPARAYTNNEHYGIILTTETPDNIVEISVTDIYLGLSVDYMENSIEVDTSNQFTVVCYDEVTVTGNIPGDMKEIIKTILLKGTRLWHEVF